MPTWSGASRVFLQNGQPDVAPLFLPGKMTVSLGMITLSTKPGEFQGHNTHFHNAQLLGRPESFQIKSRKKVLDSPP